MNQILIHIQVFAYKTPTKRNSRTNILIILWGSNLRFSQVKWYRKRNQTLKQLISWESPSSFRETFTTSTSNYLFFKTKFQEFKNLNQSKIIELTITKTNAKKTCGFACKVWHWS